MKSKKLTSFFNFSDGDDDDEETVVVTAQESPVIPEGDELRLTTTWQGAAHLCGGLFNESDCSTLIKPGYTYYTRNNCKCDAKVPYCSIHCTWQQCKMCLTDFCRHCVTLSESDHCDECVAKYTPKPNLIVLSDSDGAVFTPNENDDDDDDAAVVIRRDVSSPLLLSSDEEEEDDDDDESSLTLGSRDTEEEATLDESSVSDLSISADSCECTKEECRALKRKIDRVMLENSLLKEQLEASSSGNKRRKHCFYVKMIY